MVDLENSFSKVSPLWYNAAVTKPTHNPMPFDEVMRRALTIKPAKQKKVSRPKGESKKKGK